MVYPGAQRKTEKERKLIIALLALLTRFLHSQMSVGEQDNLLSALDQPEGFVMGQLRRVCVCVCVRVCVCVDAVNSRA